MFMNKKVNSENRLIMLRKKVDKIDKQLIQLLAKRQMLIEKIGIHKRNRNLGIISKYREKFIMNKQLHLAKKKNIDLNLIESIYKLIFKNSRKIQRGI